MSYLILLGVIGVVLWFWYDTVKTQQIAKHICKKMCHDHRLQLLDDSIALSQLGLGRNERGQLQLRRTYEFEFSADFQNRQRGMLQLEGKKLRLLELPGYVERTILPV